MLSDNKRFLQETKSLIWFFCFYVVYLSSQKNKTMIVAIVCIGILALGFLISFLVFSRKMSKRQKLCKEWKVGDKLILVTSCRVNNELHKQDIEYATLAGCNPDDVIVSVGTNSYVISWDEVLHNKSHIWRTHYEKCKESMGVEPSFTPIVNEPNSGGNLGKIDGKPIELLTEIECQIYLKQALDNEDFELAEKIKQQMQKFR